MMTSEKLDKILPALAKVKKELGGVVKAANNPFFKSKYADLNTYLEEVEPRLGEAGLMLLQPVQCGEQGQNVVSSRIFHVESGQFVESSMRLVGESDMQKAGSAVTYARRYTLGSLLSMQAVDDDGNTAAGKDKKETVAPKAAASSVPKLTPKPEPQAEAKVAAPTVDKPSFRKNKTTPAPTIAQEAEAVQGDDI